MRTASKLVRGVWLAFAAGGALSCALTMSFDGYDISSAQSGAFVALRGTVEGLEGDDASVRFSYGAAQAQVLGNGTFEIPNALARGSHFRISADSDLHVCAVEHGEGEVSSDVDVHVVCNNADTRLAQLALGAPARLVEAFVPDAREAAFRAPLLYWTSRAVAIDAVPIRPSAKVKVGLETLEPGTPTPITYDGGVLELTVTAKSGDSGTYDLRLHPVTFIKPAVVQPRAMAFATALAASGDRLVVGAPFESSGRPDAADDMSMDASGAAYVLVQRDGGAWSQEAYLKSPTPQSGTRFAGSLALDGDTLAIASPATRRVFVYRRSGSAWTLEATLVPSLSGSPPFGDTVAIRGELIIIGVPSDNGGAIGVNAPTSAYNETSNTYASGAAYVFRRNAAQWRAEAYLKASSQHSQGYFGSDVAVDGDTVVVGAPGESSPIGHRAAYAFRWTGTAWVPDARLEPSRADSLSFGRTIAACGDGGFLVTAMGARALGGPPDPSTEGAVHVFRRAASGWSEEALLKASNARRSTYFGISASCSGDLAVVGAAFESSASTTSINGDQSASPDEYGAAYVFRRNAGAWSQIAYLKAWNAERNLGFGAAVATNGNVIAVGTPNEATAAAGIFDPFIDGSIPDVARIPGTGAVYVY